MKITKKSAVLSIICTVLVLILMGTQLSKLQFNDDLDAFFPVDDPDLIYYKSFAEVFGNDSDYLFVALDNNAGVFKQDFLLRTDSLVHAIEQLGSTRDVLAITNLKKSVKTPMGIVSYPYLHLNDPKRLVQDSIKVYQELHIRDQFLAQGLNSTKLIINHKLLVDKIASDAYLDSLELIIGAYAFDKVHLAGKPVGQRAYVHAVQQDFTFFLVFSGVTIVIMLIIFIRRASMVATSLILSFLSVFATMSFMGLMGKDIDILSTLIPSILLVVSMSDIIHLYTYTKESYLGGNSLPDAINDAVKHVGFATLLTSVTTAIGFITLVSIRVRPIIDLGVYAAVGIVFAFVLTYLLFPQMMYLIKPQMHRRKKNRRIQAFLVRLLGWILQKQRQIFIAFGVSLILVVYGMMQLEVNAFLVDDLPENNQAREDFLFFDREYLGTKPFIMTFWLRDSTASIYTPEHIKTLETVTQAIKKTTNFGNIGSPVSLVKSVNQMLHSGLVDEYRLPESKQGWGEVLRFIKKERLEERFVKMTDKNLAVISASSQDFGSKVGTVQREALTTALNQTLDLDRYGFQLTGSTRLIEKSQETLSMNLLKGIFAAIIIVSILSGLMFRSWRMTLITLIPNLFPILAIAAIMGYFGITINLGTSIIFAISFGIVVDDTIHFLSKLRAERLDGRSMAYAIKRTIYTTGEPIIVTTIILTSGFVIFCFSNFAATFNTGLFVSVSFIVALIADLTLLPVLILYFLPRRNLKRTK